MIVDLRSGLILACVVAWHQVLRLGPYVAGGVALAAVLGQFDLPRRWKGWLRRGGLPSVVGAVCLGAVSPVSTYGTVPMLLRLLREGASPGPVLAFLSASTMLNPQLFLLILGGLGWRVALTQAAGVLLLSGAAGWVAMKVSPAALLHPAARSDDAPSDPTPRRFSWSRLGRDLLELTGWVGLTFTIGVILAALLQVLVPPQWVARWLGEGHWTGVALAGILGVPLYTCGGSAIPVLSTLTHSGMGRGAALAFLLSGPATRVTALAAVGTLLNRRALVAYAVCLVAGAMLVGTMLG